MGCDTMRVRYYFFNDMHVFCTDSPPPKCHLLLKFYIIK